MVMRDPADVSPRLAQTPQPNPPGFLENPSATEIALFDTLDGLFKGRRPRQTSLQAAS